MKPAIKDPTAYLSSMRKSIEDKLFFLDDIPQSIGTIIDLGCADGSLLCEALRKTASPFRRVIGVDSNQEFLRAAMSNLQISLQDNPHLTVELYSSLSSFLSSKRPNDPSTTVINASSFLHEAGIDCLPFSYGAEYISIRDMFHSPKDDLPMDIGEIKKIFANQEYGVIAEDFFDTKAQLDFFGQQRYIREFLLHYRFQSNWERERDELYLDVRLPDLVGQAEQNGYVLMYCMQYTPRFIKERVKADFDIDLDFTHANLLFKRQANERRT